MVRRVGHFEVLVIDKYRYGERFFHRKVKIFHLTGNPPPAYQHLSSKSFRTARNRRAVPKLLVDIRVANLGDFSPKNANFRILIKSILGIFNRLVESVL
jgi:hypothetical protein